jgi:LAO/AO transport system kinase
MAADDLRWRQAFARKLTERARAGALEVMQDSIDFGGKARRIGITGPPGAGKSSLIAMLAKYWARTARKVGVLAVDPTSPLSGGSLLGDRIRMDAIAEDPNVFIRSLSSGSSHDGLCPNISSLLDAFEQAEFEFLVLETVGVGQVSYEARSLVDTLVLVLVPDSGDTVQAMKAGVLEVADIYVVNKADLPASVKLATELRSIAGWRGRNAGWVPPVILTSTVEACGAAELAEAVEAHRRSVLTEERQRTLAIARREYHLRSLILRRIDEVLASHRHELQDTSIADAIRLLVDRLRDDTRLAPTSKGPTGM